MTTPRSDYAPVNGLRLYYEIYGAGQPLILLHGGFGLTGMFASLMPQLAANRQVIAVDLQAHGRTADIDRPLSLEAMGDDVGKLIEHLGFAQADVMGYSMGGGAALQAAIQHPERVRKLVIVSIPFKRNGWYPEQTAGMDQIGAHTAEFMKSTPMYEAYTAVAPHPENFTQLCAKMGEMMHRDYDYSEGVKGLIMPVLIVAADADGFPPSHAAEFFALLGGGQRDGSWDRSGMPKSQLAIIPNMTHYDIFESPALLPIVDAFLDAPLP
jgi:pimeloyl-ACP methyl ester carboxylesterase